MNFRLPNPATHIDPELAYNGGSTRTYAVSINSNVVDSGDYSLCKDFSTTPWIFLTVDQNGDSRKFDGDKDLVEVCDIGSVEYHH